MMNTIALATTKAIPRTMLAQDRVLTSRSTTVDKKQSTTGCLTSVIRPLLQTGSGLGVALIIGGMSVFCDPAVCAPLEFGDGMLFGGSGPTPSERLRAAEEQFQSSDLLKELKKRTEENRETNQRDIEAKYCLRQAELGIGDCGGLKDLPEALEELKNMRQ